MLLCDLLYSDRYLKLLAACNSNLLGLLILTYIKQDEFTDSLVFQAQVLGL